MRAMDSRWVCAGILIAIVMSFAASSVQAAEDAAPPAQAPAVERLDFPETAEPAPLKFVIAPLAQQQAAVPLPTPEFTGMTAIAALCLLLLCRKAILRLVC